MVGIYVLERTLPQHLSGAPSIAPAPAARAEEQREQKQESTALSHLCVFEIYKEKKGREEKSKKAMEWARELSWKNVTPKWVELFDKATNSLMKI